MAVAPTTNISPGAMATEPSCIASPETGDGKANVSVDQIIPATLRRNRARPMVNITREKAGSPTKKRMTRRSKSTPKAPMIRSVRITVIQKGIWAK